MRNKGVLAACILYVVFLASKPEAQVVKVSRADMIATAKQLAEHQWTAEAAHLKATCLKRYRSPWTEGQVIVGVAYDWGGMDNAAAFEAKLRSAHAAGSHQSDGSSACTAGVDCSGLISLCWRQKRKFGTATIEQIASKLRDIDITKDLKPGDALNLSGVHIVLFGGYNADGTINVYEALGPASRVVFSQKYKLTRFRRYTPVRYMGTVD